MFKITNAQLIEMAAVDAGLDPFAEYCTKGVYKANGYKVRAGEKPVLTLDLWCPRQSKEQAETLNSSDSQQGGTSVSGLFFQFKKCHLFTRAQVVSAEELQAEKESRKFKKAQEKAFKKAVMAQGGIKPSQDYESIPKWARRKNGAAIDEAVAEVAANGFYCEDADGLFGMLQAI